MTGSKKLLEGFGVALRDAVIVTVVAGIVGLLVNLFHPEAIPYIADKEYQILVPCPETSGKVTPLEATHPDLHAEHVFVVDARSKKEHQAWNFRQAMNVTFDYLVAVPDEVMVELTNRIAGSRAQRVVVYGDGSNPDTGEQLGKEISGRGIRNVYFVKGGAPALKKAQGGGS